MNFWAVEFLVNPSGRRERWHLDVNTIRRTRHAALQAPLDNDKRPEFWDRYTAMRRQGKARAVKVRVYREAL